MVSLIQKEALPLFSKQQFLQLLFLFSSAVSMLCTYRVGVPSTRHQRPVWLLCSIFIPCPLPWLPQFLA